MNTIILRLLVVVNVVFIIGFSSLFAHQGKPDSPFSHKGIKAALALGAFDNSASKLSEGQALSLNLGYGFSDKTTLWLTVAGAEHPTRGSNEFKTEFDALELNFQYKFRPLSRLQPYGKVGIGGYQLKERGTDVKIIGGGMAFALGADFLFSEHFGFGLELAFKNIEYFRREEKVNGGKLVSDLNPRIERESLGFLVTFTIQ